MSSKSLELEQSCGLNEANGQTGRQVKANSQSHISVKCAKYICTEIILVIQF
jgi:hypothetical protein